MAARLHFLDKLKQDTIAETANDLTRAKAEFKKLQAAAILDPKNWTYNDRIDKFTFSGSSPAFASNSVEEFRTFASETLGRTISNVGYDYSHSHATWDTYPVLHTYIIEFAKTEPSRRCAQ